MNTVARQPPANMTGDGPKWMQSETKCDKCAVNRDSVAPHHPRSFPPATSTTLQCQRNSWRPLLGSMTHRVQSARLLLSLHHCDKHILLAVLSRSLVMYHGKSKASNFKNLQTQMLLTFTVRRLVGCKMAFFFFFKGIRADGSLVNCPWDSQSSFLNGPWWQKITYHSLKCRKVRLIFVQNQTHLRLHNVTFAAAARKFQEDE